MGTYEGFFELNNFGENNESVNTVKKDFAFDILAPINERTFKTKVDGELLSYSSFHSKSFIFILLIVMLFFLHFSFFKSEYIVLKKAIYLYAKISKGDRFYEELFKFFYSSNEGQNYNLVDDMSSRVFDNDKLNNIVEKLSMTKDDSFRFESKDHSNRKVGFLEAYLLVRRFR